MDECTDFSVCDLVPAAMTQFSSPDRVALLSRLLTNPAMSSAVSRSSARSINAGFLPDLTSVCNSASVYKKGSSRAIGMAPGNIVSGEDKRSVSSVSRIPLPAEAVPRHSSHLQQHPRRMGEMSEGKATKPAPGGASSSTTAAKPGAMFSSDDSAMSPRPWVGRLLNRRHPRALARIRPTQLGLWSSPRVGPLQQHCP